jgi:predicted ArsR family transcriptional regulator
VTAPRHTARDSPGGGAEASDAGRRSKVLRELRLMGRPAGVAELADVLGVHPNTIRFHLDKLVGDGRVDRVRGQGGAPGRPPTLYRAVRAMDPAGPRHFRLLAEVLVRALSAHPDPGGQAADAGREWGRGRALADGPGGSSTDGSADGSATPVDRLVGLLDELGFTPEPAPGAAGPDASRAGWLGLRSCPFLELATAQPGVVCPVHLGLMQGALQGWGADVTVDRLDPFVQPDLCLAHLAPA